MNSYLQTLKKYATFAGRARRREYWTFVLVNFVIEVVLTVLEQNVFGSGGGTSILSTLFSLAVLLPAIAVGVRRMHDTDHSGWWLLFPIVNLVFALTGGTKGDNRFGPDPKAA